MSAGGGKKKKGLAKMAAHVGPNMTPMVDIVMCILIFFMLGSTFLAPEVFLTSNMVAADKGLGTKESKVEMPKVRVEIHLKEEIDSNTGLIVTKVKADNPHFGGDWLPVGRPDHDDISASKRDEETSKNGAIASRLRALHDAGLSDEALVVLRPRGQVPYEDVIKVYDACMKARFAKVAFAPASAG